MSIKSVKSEKKKEEKKDCTDFIGLLKGNINKSVVINDSKDVVQVVQVLDLNNEGLVVLKTVENEEMFFPIKEIKKIVDVKNDMSTTFIEKSDITEVEVAYVAKEEKCTLFVYSFSPK